MDFDNINTQHGQTGLQGQVEHPTEQDNLLGAQESLDIAKIRGKEKLHNTIQFWLRLFIIFAVIIFLAIMIVGAISFLIPAEYQWLDRERLHEIRGFFVGVLATVAAPSVIEKLKNED